MTPRNIAVALFGARSDSREAAANFINAICDHNIACWLSQESAAALSTQLADGVDLHILDKTNVPDLELVVVFGGDGTILRAAEWAVPAGIPVLGINLGHVGFLAELERHQLDTLIEKVVDRSYEIEERLCLQVQVFDSKAGELLWESFAMNEVSVEKTSRQRMIEVLVEIDGHPLQRWGTDGVLVSTPTGSTAYAFSAQGPVMWPDLDALLVVPLLAHALFARPLVLSPRSNVTIEILREQETSGVVWCDGRRSFDVTSSQVVRVERHPTWKLKLARMSPQPFVERLVRKFELPVAGWRGNAADRLGKEMTTSVSRTDRCSPSYGSST